MARESLLLIFRNLASQLLNHVIAWHWPWWEYLLPQKPARITNHVPLTLRICLKGEQGRRRKMVGNRIIQELFQNPPQPMCTFSPDWISRLGSTEDFEIGEFPRWEGRRLCLSLFLFLGKLGRGAEQVPGEGMLCLLLLGCLLLFPSSCLFVVLSSQNLAGSLVLNPSTLAACQNHLGSFKKILMPKLTPSQIRMSWVGRWDGSTSDSDVPLRWGPLLGEASGPSSCFIFTVRNAKQPLGSAQCRTVFFSGGRALESANVLSF